MVTIWFTLFSATSFVVVVAAVLFSIFDLRVSSVVNLSLHGEQLSVFLSTCCLCFFGEKHTAITEESCFCTVNEKYSDPFVETMLELTFCRYPMRHGALDGVGKVAAELAAELAAVPAGVLSAGIAGEGVVELVGEGTFVLVFQV